MYLNVARFDDLVARSFPLPQGWLLLLQEDLQRPAAGGSMHPLSGYLQAPSPRLLAQVPQRAEPGARKEPRAGKLNRSLHDRFITRTRRPGRVNQQIPVAGVGHKVPGQSRPVAVDAGDGRREVVDHQVFGHPFEEFPGPLQALDRIA